MIWGGFSWSVIRILSMLDWTLISWLLVELIMGANCWAFFVKFAVPAEAWHYRLNWNSGKPFSSFSQFAGQICKFFPKAQSSISWTIPVLFHDIELSRSHPRVSLLPFLFHMGIDKIVSRSGKRSIAKACWLSCLSSKDTIRLIVAYY